MHPQLGVKLCAIVEFGDSKLAESAIPIIKSKWNQAYVKLLSELYFI